MVARVCGIHGLYAGRACPACKTSRATSAATRRWQRASAADRIRSSARWKRVAARILVRDGHRCTFGLYDEDDARGVPAGGCRARLGVDVHHRVPIEDGGDPFDDANLRSLCERHHASVEQAYRAAKEDDRGEAEVVEF